MKLGDYLKQQLIEKELIPGGLASGKSIKDIARKHGVHPAVIKSQVKKGIKVEKEHTPCPKVAKEIAKDHEMENEKYYSHLKTMEKQMDKGD